MTLDTQQTIELVGFIANLEDTRQQLNRLTESGLYLEIDRTGGHNLILSLRQAGQAIEEFQRGFRFNLAPAPSAAEERG